jgi:glycine/D-amino acid oxidase-like deaminating enzyme
VQPRASQDLIVVGAGIIGSSIAWHATRAGIKTLVIDESGPVAGASGASDGAVSVATKRPGIMASLAAHALSYTTELAEPCGVLNACFHRRPSYLFATTPREMAALDALSDMLSHPDVPVSVVADGGLKDVSVQGLGPAVLRVMELTGEGHMTGYDAALAFLRESGADTLWPCRVTELEAAEHHVTLVTSAGRLDAARVVIANGLGARALLPGLPITPRSGQLIITERAAPAGFPHPAGALTSAAYLLDKTTNEKMNNLPAPVVIDPLATGQLLIGSSRENDGDARQTDFHTVRRILNSAVACLPALAQRRIIRVFAGVRAACGDGRPIVGALGEAPNVIVATGFEGDGICLAPLIGREIARHLTGEPVLSRLGTLSPDRFTLSPMAAQ